jgi:predicted nucleic acid-binding protein
MSSEPPAVYWDSCCFIARIQREADRIAEVESLTKLAEEEKLIIVTSTLTIAEVLYEPSSELAAENGFNSIKEFFENPWIIMRAPDRRTMELAGEIRLKHPKLQVGDAIHIATALRWKKRIVELHSYDARHLLILNGVIGTPPLKIVAPRYPEDYPLFDALPAVAEPPVLRLVTENDIEPATGAPTAPPAILPPTSTDESAGDQIATAP